MKEGTNRTNRLSKEEMAAVCALLRANFTHLSARHLHLGSSIHKLVQFNLSDIGEGIREVTVKSWFIKEDDVVSQFDEICEVESDKATVSITSRFDGKITKLYHRVGDVALVGQPLVDIDVRDDGESAVQTPDGNSNVPTESGSPQEEEEKAVESERDWNKSLATPAVRRIAMEKKVKLSDVKGSAKNGTVVNEDILAYLETLKRVGKSDLQNLKATPLNSIQKVMTKTLTETLKIPQFTICDQVDVTKLSKLRSEVKEAAIKKGIQLSFLPFFLKAISNGLLEYPILNSSFDSQQEMIVYKSSHNIGIAMEFPGGLLVPNIKDVQRMSVVEVATELNRLQVLASKMKLPPNDLTGGTLSVSNIGAIAGTTVSPVTLPPEVCMVVIGRIQTLPRFEPSGAVVPASIISTSWCADHRIIDGATLARCIAVFRHYVEHPAELPLGV